MDGLGLDAAKDFQPVYLERAGDGPAMVLDGRVAALWGGGAGWPGFTTVAKSDTGARFIAPDAGEIHRILAKHSFLKEVTQAAGSFPARTRPFRPSVLGASCWRGRVSTTPWPIAWPRRCMSWSGRVSHPGNWSTPPPTTPWCRPGRRLHPGVARYFRETGLCVRNLAPRSTFPGLHKPRSVVMEDKAKKDGRIEGEGSYSGTKAYNEATTNYLKKGKFDEAAREARRALDSKEAAELKAAEAKGRSGNPKVWEHNPSRPK